MRIEPGNLWIVAAAVWTFSMIVHIIIGDEWRFSLIMVFMCFILANQEQMKERTKIRRSIEDGAQPFFY